jgi:hypothetical protein
MKNRPRAGRWGRHSFDSQSAVTLASIRDGTSNAIFLAEQGHGKLDPSVRDTCNLWNSGDYGDTMSETSYPINGRIPVRGGAGSAR